MKISKRMYSAALAGVLACSLGAGSLAFAADGGPLLQNISERAGAAKGALPGQQGGQPADPEPAPVENPAPQAAPDTPGTPDVPDTPGTPDVPDTPDTPGGTAFGFLEQSVPSFITIVQGPLTYQVIGSWDATDLSEDDATWYYFEDDDGMFECVVYPESVVGNEDAFLDEYLAYFAEDLPTASFSEPADRYLDGVLIRDVSYSATQGGLEFRGILTVVFGYEYVAVADSVFLYDPSFDLGPQYVQVHRSMGFSDVLTEPALPTTAV